MTPSAITTWVTSLLLVLLLAPFSVLAQDAEAPEAPPLMLGVDYMKSKSADYVQVEQEIWKPIHQSRIDAGEMVGWYLYQISYPYGTKTKYDYATVNVYAGAEALHGVGDGLTAHAQKVHAGKDIDAMMTQTGDARDLVWGEVFWLQDQVDPGPSEQPAPVIRVNFMHVAEGNGGAYAEMERTHYKPVHTAAVKAGHRADWLLLQRVMPFGSAAEYQYVTVDAYDSWADFVAPSPSLWSEVHGPEADANKTYLDILKLRSLARSEVWELIDYVQASPPAGN